MPAFSWFLKPICYASATAVFCFAGLPIFLPAKAATPAASTATEQIAAGVEVYTARCQRCHSEKLAGGAGPPLRGDDFVAQWDGKPLRALYGRILMTMPYDDPGSLTPEQVLSLVSYIASENHFAEWTSPFVSPNELTNITIEQAK
jgi:mono/diheme cytochrome c family protein